MGLLEDVTTNPIEALARALFAQLQILTGARATGTVLARALTQTTALPPNRYLVPIVGGQRREDLLFKVAFNPSTELEHKQGGEWQISTTGTNVTIVSNLGGGPILNLPAGTKLKWEPAIAGLADEVTVQSPGLAGASASGPLKHCRFFEELSTANAQRDMFAAKLGDFPAAMLVWEGSSPVEGLTSGIRQGASRKSRLTVLYRETFTLFLISTRQNSDPQRRRDGLVLLSACSRLLTDRKANNDGEMLSTAGTGVQISDRFRLARYETSYIYGLRLRCIASLTRVETRTFNPWDTTRVVMDADAQPPLLPAELEVVDVSDEMPDE